MAWQLHVDAGRPRTRFFTIRGGYHGDTFSPMSVSDPVGGMHTLFTGVLPEHVFAPRPPAGVDLPDDDPAMVAWEQATRALYAEHADEVAAVIVEPVLQGAGGHARLQPVRRAASSPRWPASTARWSSSTRSPPASGAPARSGRPTAAASCRTSCAVGKALTGGYLTLAATLCTAEVAEGVSGGRVRRR